MQSLLGPFFGTFFGKQKNHKIVHLQKRPWMSKLSFQWKNCHKSVYAHEVCVNELMQQKQCTTSNVNIDVAKAALNYCNITGWCCHLPEYVLLVCFCNCPDCGRGSTPNHNSMSKKVSVIATNLRDNIFASPGAIFPLTCFLRSLRCVFQQSITKIRFTIAESKRLTSYVCDLLPLAQGHCAFVWKTVW